MDVHQPQLLGHLRSPIRTVRPVPVGGPVDNGA
jgi:hypothetical protein